jgi:hypothetical protein
LVAKIPRRIVVTFQEGFSSDLVEGLVENHFLGLGVTYRGDSERVVSVLPDPERFPALKAQLEVWEREGALTFKEEFD